ncbi:hypothetical protein RLOC_00001515 [Lonchura striata]|uniref:Uncharacterized protein n=1 Tax=Lonchura striata TaxID=40157 RepID=A0A218V7Y8_9PASE|nr:hypothetical protein RLOC_00001515 [Lonchura striata domestica]
MPLTQCLATSSAWDASCIGQTGNQQAQSQQNDFDCQGTLSPPEQGHMRPEAMRGLVPEMCAELFQNQKHLQDPMLPWLCQRLEALYGSQWWLTKNAEGHILQALCLCGLDGKLLFQMLQPDLEGYTAPLVYGLINVIVHGHSTEALRLLQSHAVGKKDHNTAASSTSCWEQSLASPTSSPEGSDMENQASTSQTAFHRDNDSPSSVSLSAE